MADGCAGAGLGRGSPSPAKKVSGVTYGIFVNWCIEIKLKAFLILC